MTKAVHQVNLDACKGDGICVEVCPKDLLEIKEGKASSVEAAALHCIRCGQCVAVCANDALALEGLEATTFARSTDDRATFDAFVGLLRSRRSVRVFSPKPVARELIDRVLDAAALAPPAMLPHTTEVLIIDQAADREELVRALVSSYDKLVAAFNNPVGRLIIRLKRGAETMAAIAGHVLQIVRWDNECFRTRGVDRYTYAAPVVLLFHANRWQAAYQESAMVVATYAMLAAHALGLGATMLSIVPPALNNVAHQLRRSYGIPDDNVVVVSLILGHPKYKYRQTIQRRLRQVRYLRPS